MESQLRQVIEFLVRQQFYKPVDIIMDRSKEQEIHVKDSGQAIEQFTAILSDGLPKILEGAYESYLDKLRKKITFNREVVQRLFYKRLMQLSQEEMMPQLIVTFLMGGVISDIREKNFKIRLQILKQRFLDRMQQVKKGDFDFDDIITASFERNDRNIALIYSLSFLEFIAKTVQLKELLEHVESLLAEYMTRFIENLG